MQGRGQQVKEGGSVGSIRTQLCRRESRSFTEAMEHASPGIPLSDPLISSTKEKTVV